MTTDDLEEHYISENVSALGGSTGDADAVGAATSGKDGEGK